MNRWLLIALNVVLLGLVLLTIPMVMRYYEPYDQNSRGVDALKAGDYDKAITYLSGAVESKPSDENFKHNLLAAYNNKAMHLSDSGKVEDALPAYEQALELSPDDQALLINYTSALNNLAVSKADEREFAQAQSYFEKATQVLPRLKRAEARDSIRQNYSGLLTLWGTELMKRNQVRDAMQAFEQAVKLDPKNGVAFLSLGDLAYEANNYPSAARAYSAAVELNPENKGYLENRLEMIQQESEVESKFRTLDDPKKRFFLQFVPYKGGTSVEQVLDMLNEAWNVIGRDLGVYPARAVNVKVYSQEDFFRVAKLPEWAIGIFDGKMRLRADELQSAPELVQDLIFHEYTHAVLAMNIKQEIPAWFHEGIAQLMEPQFRENNREQEQVRLALARHQIGFDQLEDSFKEITNKGDAENAYLMSKYFLTYLNRKYGHEKLREWIKRLTRGDRFSAAFEAVYHGKLTDAQQNWIKSQLKQ